jgi:hypothetical protein
VAEMKDRMLSYRPKAASSWSHCFIFIERGNLHLVRSGLMGKFIKKSQTQNQSFLYEEKTIKEIVSFQNQEML